MYWLNPRTWFRRPHPLLVENHRYFSEFRQSRSLTELSFVAFDTELTGLNRRHDDIVSIGAVRISNLQIDFSDTFYQVVRPKVLTRTGSTAIHRLAPAQLASAPVIGDILPDFVEFIGTSLIVGHYLDLDVFFLNRATWITMGGILSNPGIDTMRMAQGFNRIRQGYFSQAAAPQSYRLADLSRRYGLPQYNSHNAFADAVQSACLFLWLIKKFRSGGIDNLRDLYRAGHYRV